MLARAFILAVQSMFLVAAAAGAWLCGWLLFAAPLPCGTAWLPAVFGTVCLVQVAGWIRIITIDARR